MYQRGRAFIGWLEKERKLAVRVHLNDLSARLRNPPNPPTRGVQIKSSTDSGLHSNTLHSQGGIHTPVGPTGSLNTSVEDGTVSASSDGRQAGDGGSSGRIEVVTTQDAAKVAERRKTNLASKRMDKCPLCQQHHMYERTWGQGPGAIKANLLSTHLDSCPKFRAMTGEQKLAAVSGQSGLPGLYCLGPLGPPLSRRQGSQRSQVLLPGWRGSLRCEARPMVS